MTLRAVLFDLDDTLIPEWPPIDAAYAAVAERVWGARNDERIDALREAALAVWRSGVDEDYRRRMHFSLGEGLWGEFVDPGPEGDALRAFVPTLHATAFDAVLPEPWRGRSSELVSLYRATRIAALTSFPETEAVLTDWGAHVELVLVTNGASRLQRAKLAATRLDRFFAPGLIVVSEDVGVGKPDAVMFEAALAAAGVRPEEAVMVGNDVARDVAGARAAGIRAIWIRRDSAATTRSGRESAGEQIADLRELRDRLVDA